MLKCAELFVKKLESKDFKFDVKEFEDGDVLVNFPYSGKNLNLIFSGDDGVYLSLYLNFEKVPEGKMGAALVACNKLNAQYKWVTLYIDKDNDIIFHDDAILSVDNAADEAFELTVRIFNIMDDVKPEIMKALYA